VQKNGTTTYLGVVNLFVDILHVVGAWLAVHIDSDARELAAHPVGLEYQRLLRSVNVVAAKPERPFLSPTSTGIHWAHFGRAALRLVKAQREVHVGARLEVGWNVTTRDIVRQRSVGATLHTVGVDGDARHFAASASVIHLFIRGVFVWQRQASRGRDRASHDRAADRGGKAELATRIRINKVHRAIADDNLIARRLDPRAELAIFIVLCGTRERAALVTLRVNLEEVMRRVERGEGRAAHGGWRAALDCLARRVVLVANLSARHHVEIFREFVVWLVLLVGKLIGRHARLARVNVQAIARRRAALPTQIDHQRDLRVEHAEEGAVVRWLWARALGTVCIERKTELVPCVKCASRCVSERVQMSGQAWDSSDWWWLGCSSR
jgi:hypothetical protein